jgi:hypothetical protein
MGLIQILSSITNNNLGQKCDMLTLSSQKMTLYAPDVRQPGILLDKSLMEVTMSWSVVTLPKQAVLREPGSASKAHHSSSCLKRVTMGNTYV